MDYSAEILQLAKQNIEDECYFPVEVVERGKHKFVLYMDGMKGIGVDQCATWNLSMRSVIEQSIPSLSEGDFELEVSSFGIGRSLKDERQFMINKGRKVVVQYPGVEGAVLQIEGVLQLVDGDSITVEIKNKKQTQLKRIEKKNIKRIYTEVTF